MQCRRVIEYGFVVVHTSLTAARLSVSDSRFARGAGELVFAPPMRYRP
ncbi:hypothetical protein [Nocardia seriolae]|uniref:Uncharacterized protein n=1 Tax=Nocardia seriolae TaxID=37332 RepID=A0ABC8B101_9NOCA|nr:hypothetical protein [Nocardia seriolae]APA99920.1 hypothetical protein NS506_05884 [Nocardia seriolae]MTJ64606.1 hypothetical protein [Nocardia seriolae]MTJ72125.1 hypothetical protein [Nocardia seriolae]MTJ89449.1 hypothetical protein [Nocardia seriolae]MTK33425.1 hypothetical protein [Nocardia seriolae]